MQINLKTKLKLKEQRKLNLLQRCCYPVMHLPTFLWRSLLFFSSCYFWVLFQKGNILYFFPREEAKQLKNGVLIQEVKSQGGVQRGNRLCDLRKTLKRWSRQRRLRSFSVISSDHYLHNQNTLLNCLILVCLIKSTAAAAAGDKRKHVYDKVNWRR